MPAPTRPPISAAQLREFADNQDGFGFELEIYRHAKGLNMNPRHAGTYEDPATGKHRQFDIRATAQRDNLRIHMAIECKCLTADYPLLVSRVPRPREDSVHSELYSDGVMSSARAGYARLRSIRGARSIYRPDEAVGKSLSQVRFDPSKASLVGSDDSAFDKWMQAVASACELARDAVESLVGNHSSRPRHLVIPILAVSDGTLWAADYSANGQLQGDPMPVEDTSFYIGRMVQLPGQAEPFQMTHLHIFTRSALREMLVRLDRTTDLWEDMFLPPQ